MRRFVLFAMVLLFAAACDARLNVTTDFTSNQSGQLVVQAGGDQDLLSMGLLDDAPQQLTAAGFDVGPWSQGDITGIEGTYPFDSLDELNRAVASLGLSGFGSVFDSFTVSTGDGSDLVFNAHLSSVDANPFGTTTVQIAVKMPGRVLSDNADSRSDGRLVWTAHAGDPARTLTARSTGSQSFVGITALIAAVVAGLVIGGRLLMRRWTERDDDSSMGAVHCTQCGTRLPGGARFCANCGATVQSGPDG